LLFVTFILGVQLQKLASDYGDLRVYDVIDDAITKSTGKSSKTKGTKKKSN